MEDFALESGKRLRNIREIFNEGGKLSAEQFGFAVNESSDKIINYELGRTAIPIKLLYEIYKRGFNPNYIISGNAPIFLNDKNGNKLKNLFKDKTLSSTISSSERAKIIAALEGGEEFTKLCEVTSNYKVAAGRIKK